ncbi:MAG TPA: FMN-binding negative transcriptional regulator [Alphaproteobacteria bacterium]|jgi:transcriptional regulator|nr:FMN-binding negative transcriptional regulator [Alphaproteobacteria bacterium]
MYIPKGFEVEDLPTLHDFMERNSFAVLFGTVAGAPFATHLPLLVDRDRGPNGTIVGHVARANPHGGAFDGKTPALAIFTGAHAYVSPTWYNRPNVVPTWLYTAVHAYGTPRATEDQAVVHALLDRMVKLYESGFERPWQLSGQSPSYLETMRRGVIAFEMPIDRIEGKYKLNQIKSEADRRGTIAGLQSTDDAMAHEVAELMLSLEP